MAPRAYKHVPIASALREAIAAGTYPPGARLPSHTEIARTFAVGDRTARAALRSLIDDGLATSRRRHGVYVTGAATLPDAQVAPARPRRTHTARRHRPADAPTTGEEDTTATITVTIAPCPADVALTLDIDPDTAVCVRRRLLTDTYGPLAIRVSYTPRSLTQTTAVEEPDPLPDPWPTTLARLTGHQPVTVLTHTSTRRPSTADADALNLTPADPVLVHDETTATTYGPIDVTRTTYRPETRLSDQYTPQT